MEACSRRNGYIYRIYRIFFHLDSGFYPREKDQSLISYLSQSCRNKIPCGMQAYSPSTKKKQSREFHSSQYLQLSKSQPSNLNQTSRLPQQREKHLQTVIHLTRKVIFQLGGGGPAEVPREYDHSPPDQKRGLPDEHSQTFEQLNSQNCHMSRWPYITAQDVHIQANLKLGS